MTRLRVLISRVRATFAKRRTDARLTEEIESHLDLLAEEHVRRGMSLEEARAAARREFGGVEQMKEAYRDQRSVPFIASVLQDVRYGLRMLRKSPGFTSVALLSLALGIGANTAIFSLLDAALLRSLPVERPDELVMARKRAGARETNPSWTSFRISRGAFSTSHFRALRQHREVLTDLAAFRPWPRIRVTRDGESQLVLGQLVSGNYHAVLGVRMRLGRGLGDGDDRIPGGHPVVVISHGYWQRQFGGDPSIIGQRLEITGQPFTIVGVTAREFFGTEPGRSVDVTVPLSMQPLIMPGQPLLSENSNAQWLYLIGRLAPNTPRDRATARLGLVWEQLSAARNTGPKPQTPLRFELFDGAQGLNDLRARFSLPLRIVMALVSLVLVIASANVASLLIARSTARQQEIGLRLALGASRGRVFRQLLTESLLLALFGGAAGVLLAYVGSTLLVQMISRGVEPIAVDLAPNTRTLTFTLLVSALTAVLFGMIPAARATRPNLMPTLKSGADKLVGRGGRWGDALIAAQMTLCLLLVVQAGLFVRSLYELRRVDAGFERGTVLLADVRPPASRYEGARATAIFKELHTAVQRVTWREVGHGLHGHASGWRAFIRGANLGARSRSARG